MTSVHALHAPWDKRLRAINAKSAMRMNITHMNILVFATNALRI